MAPLRARPRAGPLRVLALALVVVFLAIAASGLCVTNGWLTVP